MHKDTIAVAVAWPGRGEALYLGETVNTRKSVAKRVGRLSKHGELFLFAYEAGPCGYVLH